MAASSGEFSTTLCYLLYQGRPVRLALFTEGGT